MLPEASLIVLDMGDGRSESGFRFGLPPKRIFVGRDGPDGGINLTLRNSAVSRCHACLLPTESGWRVRDLRSRNKTILNQRPLPPECALPLGDGDLVSIADYLFLFATAVFDRRWLTADVVPVARGILADKAVARLPILSDALLDAGCDWAPLLAVSRPLGRRRINLGLVTYLLREAGDLPPVPSPLIADVDESARPFVP